MSAGHLSLLGWRFGRGRAGVTSSHLEGILCAYSHAANHELSPDASLAYYSNRVSSICRSFSKVSFARRTILIGPRYSREHVTRGCTVVSGPSTADGRVAAPPPPSVVGAEPTHDFVSPNSSDSVSLRDSDSSNGSQAWTCTSNAASSGRSKFLVIAIIVISCIRTATTLFTGIIA